MKSELVLLTTKKVGFLKWDVCIISFFKDELLITSLSNAKQKELFLAKKKDVKDSGGGFIKQSFAMKNVIPEYVDMITNMVKEDVRKENTESINKGIITNIKFKRASENTDAENNTTTLSKGKIVIQVNGRKMKFKHSYLDNKKDLKNYINNYLSK